MGLVKVFYHLNATQLLFLFKCILVVKRLTPNSLYYLSLKYASISYSQNPFYILPRLTYFFISCLK